MTYRVTGCRGRLLSWGSRRQKRKRSHHRKSYSPHETSLSIRENECGRMLDPHPQSIHYLSVGPPAATPSSLATNGNAPWHVTSATFLAPAQSSVSRHGF